MSSDKFKIVPFEIPELGSNEITLPINYVDNTVIINNHKPENDNYCEFIFFPGGRRISRLEYLCQYLKPLAMNINKGIGKYSPATGVLTLPCDKQVTFTEYMENNRREETLKREEELIAELNDTTRTRERIIQDKIKQEGKCPKCNQLLHFSNFAYVCKEHGEP